MDLTNGWISKWMNADWNIRWIMKAICGKKMFSLWKNECSVWKWMNEWMLNNSCENRLEIYQN